MNQDEQQQETNKAASYKAVHVNATISADSPLRLEVVNGELVIKVGINRLDGNERHPTLPEMKFDDRVQWAKDVMHELNLEEEDGATPVSDLLDAAMNAALENGSTGVALDSPTHIGTCDVCEEDQMPLRHTKKGQTCPWCS